MRLPLLILLISLSSYARGVEITPVHLDGLLQPQARIGSDGTLHVVGVTANDGGSDVVYRRRGADGVFTPPRVVNDRPKAATCIGTIRGARFALGRGDSIQVAWNGQDGKGFWYSRDFAPARDLLTTGDSVDGGGAITADGKGRIAIVYHHQAGAVDEEGRRVAVVTSDDDGTTLSAPRAVQMPAAGVCGCCSLAAGLDAKGRIDLLVRNAAKSSRDMWFIAGDGRSQVVGPWKAQSCPMSTAAVVHAGSATYLAWEQLEQIWWCKAGRAPTPAGKGKHPALAVDADGTVVVAWTVGTGWNRGGDIRWQAYDPAGAPAGSPGSQTGLPAWDAPAIVAEGPGRFTLAW